MEEQTVTEQNIVQGPMASQIAMKMLGTNGGGYVNANASHPFENPTPLSNFFQMLSIFSIGSGLTYYLGRMVKNQRHGWTVWAAMLALFICGVMLCWWAESNGNPIHQQPRRGGCRRKHGGQGSPLRHLQLRPLSRRSRRTHRVVRSTRCTTRSPHSVASFRYSISNSAKSSSVVSAQASTECWYFVVLAVFIAGLMVGRTPEYLGKKIESYDVKMAMLALLILAIDILAFSAWAIVSKWGLAGAEQQRPARPERNSLRVQLRHGEQRKCVRRY